MAAKRSGWAWAKWCRRGLAAVVVLVSLVFFGSNLVMRSGWFRGKIEGRLAMRTHLFWTVEELSWSPWGGVRMGGLRAVAAGPEAHRIPPIVEIAEIRVRPYWKELFSGRVRVRELRVTEPRGKVPVELLAQLMRSDGRVDAARLAGPDGGGSSGPDRDPTPDPPEDGGTTEEPDDGGEPPKGEPDTPGSAPGEPESVKMVEEPKVEPSGRVIVEGGDWELYSLSAPDQSLRVSGLRMDVPFNGPEAPGVLEAEQVLLAGEEVAGPIKVPVRWKQGMIEWPVGEFEWNGLTVQTAGAMRIRGRLLGRIETRVVAPRLGPQPVPGWHSARVATGPVEMRARLTGDMMRPATWQGNLVAGVRGVQVVHSARAESIVFEQARLVTDLRGGVLQLVDVTLAGEELSLFGNGLMLLDGRVYGVGRVVAAPEVAETIARVAAGAMVSRGDVESWMSPLGTPDRFFRDVFFQGRIPKVEFDLGPGRQWLDAERTMRLMRMFVTREEAEEVASPARGEEEGP